MLTNGKSLDDVKKKKKKPETDVLDYAAEINAENRAAEQDDETSESSADSSSSSEDENEVIMKKTAMKHEIIVREEDFEENEKLKFTSDVYNFTICANMTKCCSPLQQGFALKQCFIVFGVQILVAVFFLIDIGFDAF